MEHPHVFVIFGASGDLAKKKIFPTLWWLFRDGLLPRKVYFVGYARSGLTVSELSAKCQPYMKLTDHCAEKHAKFWSLNHYLTGSYDKDECFLNLNKFIHKMCGDAVNKIFYLALPPTVFKPVTEKLALHCMAKSDESTFSRVIIEKPFGHDLASSNELSDHLRSFFDEQSLYRIDHYLGKEMVQNLLVLRFANRIFAPLWCSSHIRSVMITFKEPFGTEGRGGYFDGSGMIRDVLQNHLIQILSLVAMEKPLSKSAEDIRDEKIRVLRSIKPPTLADIILGQYVGDPKAEPGTEASKGYLDDPTVPKNSITETFACVRLHVNTDRWEKVPFILRAGKGNSIPCVATHE